MFFFHPEISKAISWRRHTKSQSPNVSPYNVRNHVVSGDICSKLLSFRVSSSKFNFTLLCTFSIYYFYHSKHFISDYVTLFRFSADNRNLNELRSTLYFLLSAIQKLLVGGYRVHLFTDTCIWLSNEVERSTP